ncbi:hypothetical protein GOP47_0006309 [Adiantum capillus-veneris]|uniref:Uncharacterized protein n=1 Tax=Adiantum capillus-veneris TaxID=13818 RepID=A0A9D4ZK66_ADICA|nr:hypothetical protein GOP47_0006309 [Adiantum capillus-veneris]
MVNFQGNNTYISIDGASYVLTDEPERVDKFRVLVNVFREETVQDRAPFLDNEIGKLVASWDVTLVPTDDLTKIVYRRQSGDNMVYCANESLMILNYLTNQLKQRRQTKLIWQEEIQKRRVA